MATEMPSSHSGSTQGGYGEGIAPAADGATYVWHCSDNGNDGNAPSGLDHIADFGAGDRLDFSALFDGRGQADVHELIKLTDTAAGTVVSAAVGPCGGFTDIVVLDGLHGLDATDMADSGALVV